MNKLTHFDNQGSAIMVDVSEKAITTRIAKAMATIKMKQETLNLIKDKEIAKGDVLNVARVAGIMAVKRTPHLIPLCHPLNISSVNIDFQINDETSSIDIIVTVKISAQTGVEMEALTGATITALTVYDMCKAVDKGMIITNIKLLEKHGGKSGSFIKGI
ncbi:MAG TPA: cyclic pyranopterin monophosphate synthase MoaC [Nitrospirae bacterium]|nr:cyclic pyranopterin monophosphate synthase MoaC [Nitrospirota bacterium]